MTLRSNITICENCKKEIVKTVWGGTFYWYRAVDDKKRTCPDGKYHQPKD